MLPDLIYFLVPAFSAMFFEFLGAMWFLLEMETELFGHLNQKCNAESKAGLSNQTPWPHNRRGSKS